MINQIKTLILKLFSQIRLKKDEINGNLKYFTLLKFNASYSIDLPFSIGRTVRGVKFDSELDIYSKAVKGIINGKDPEHLINFLHNNYKNFESKEVSEVNNFIHNKKLRNYPCWAMILPWEKNEISTIKQRYLSSFYLNRSQHGIKFKNKKFEEIKSMIYSLDHAKSHINQFTSLLKNIKTNGYINNYRDLPAALIFVKGKKWIWMMSSSGNHRAHIMSELNSKYIKCKIAGIIKYSELDKSPNVLNKLFTQNEAECIFNKVFKGENPIRGPI